MSYNRWMPDKYYSGGELYHYGVKGMRWRHRKGIQIEAQEATLSGGTAPTSASGGASFYDESKERSEDEQADAAYRKYQEWQESQKPAWQKEWERSSVKKQLDSIISDLKKRKSKTEKSRPRARKRNIKSGGTGVKVGGRTGFKKKVGTR